MCKQTLYLPRESSYQPLEGNDAKKGKDESNVRFPLSRFALRLNLWGFY